jgi:hypothetical protein
MKNRLITACVNGDISKAIEYIKAGDDPSCNNNYIMLLSCIHGYIDIVKLLVNDNRVDINQNNCVIIAHCHHHYDIVNLLVNDARFIITNNVNNDISVMNIIYQIRQDKINKLLQI